MTGWATAASGYGLPGLYRGVPKLAPQLLLAPKSGWRVASRQPLTQVRGLFGNDARGWIYHLRGPRGQAIGAQVIVTSSYAAARRYGPLQCFVFHRYKIYATHAAALPHGGTTVLTALKIDRSPEWSRATSRPP